VSDTFGELVLSPLVLTPPFSVWEINNVEFRVVRNRREEKGREEEKKD
jgi:hypothetical protein